MSYVVDGVLQEVYWFVRILVYTSLVVTSIASLPEAIRALEFGWEKTKVVMEEIAQLQRQVAPPKIEWSDDSGSFPVTPLGPNWVSQGKNKLCDGRPKGIIFRCKSPSSGNEVDCRCD